MSFTHLHLHTEFSLLDGASRVNELVSRVKELGMDSVAITDHGVMYGVIEFYKECKKQGIKPIIGCEVYVSNGDCEEKNKKSYYNHLVLLAENDIGYHNLMKIVSLGFTKGYYYKPRVDKKILREYHEGIIALSACLAGEVQRKAVHFGYEESKKVAVEYKDIFGENNFYLEIQNHGIKEQQIVIENHVKLSKDIGVPIVCTNDAHYVYKEDEQAHDILLCIQTGKKLADADRMRYPGGEFYVKSEEEMKKLFGHIPNAIENTKVIADRCNVEIEFGKLKFPKFRINEDKTPFEYLKDLCMQGLYKKYSEITDEHINRLKYELDVINNMGYIDYFLIVQDFINFAKKNGINVGPGRGSAAGSIVSYVLDITEIDPLKYDLIFERFLNPERISMPDIDIDFCCERRQEVIDYVVKLYGYESVVQIITFGTMAARAVIRDIGRVMDLPYDDVDKLAKMIPTELGITIDKALTINSEFRNLVQKEPSYTYLIKMARRLEGLHRHSSIHAAGVVISGKPVTEYVPVAKGTDDIITTQYTMGLLEELGLLKMDFLGLKTLTVIENTANLVRKIKKSDFNIKEIDLSDKDVYSMISRGDTKGVFQLESPGMQSFMRELRPDSLEDIIAGLSLYRPGPMDFIPVYCKRKHGEEEVTYDTKLLEPILKNTYGCIVYQEQVMRIVRDLAGYTLGQSDLLRRAMSKKKADVMQKEREDFVFGNEARGIKGCINNGIDEKVANKVYDDMIDFAKYAFNKSHAACYALISYQTAYLKYHYPVEFMAALMTSSIDNNVKIAEYINYCKSIGIKIVPPDINISQRIFSVKEDKILFALGAIKYVGHNIIDGIIEDRDKYGDFKDLEDFINRVSNIDCNKRVIESLIKAGATDTLEGSRKWKLENFENILSGNQAWNKKNIKNQMSVFDFLEKPKKEYNNPLMNIEYDKKHLLNDEKDMTGVYITGHPLDEYMEDIKKVSTISTLDIIEDKENCYENINDKNVILGGIITNNEVKNTKNNKIMSFLLLEDLYADMEVIVFPNIYERNKQKLYEDNIVFIRGRVQSNDCGAKLICEDVYEISDIKNVVWISFDEKKDYNEEKVYSVLDDISGDATVKIWIKKEKLLKEIKDKKIAIDKTAISKLYEKFGINNVKLITSL